MDTEAQVRLHVKCALVSSDFNHKPNVSTKTCKTYLNVNFMNIRLAVFKLLLADRHVADTSNLIPGKTRQGRAKSKTLKYFVQLLFSPRVRDMDRRGQFFKRLRSTKDCNARRRRRRRRTRMKKRKKKTRHCQHAPPCMRTFTSSSCDLEWSCLKQVRPVCI